MTEPYMPWLQLAGLSKPMSKVGYDAAMRGCCGRQDVMHKARYSESFRAFREGPGAL